jgi:2-alkyl-3-oxoalkanoate reductase
MSAADAALEAAYRAAWYAVQDGEIEIDIRVDEPNPAIEALLLRYSVERAALITACNPDSSPLPEAENRARQQQLEGELANAGVALLFAHARAEDGSWHEPSFLVLGMSRAAALACAARWGQRALLLFGVDGCARLHFRARPAPGPTEAGPPATAAEVEPAAEAHSLEPSAPAVAPPADPAASDPLRPAIAATAGSTAPRVLVTGGGGFLGLALCRRLVERGYRVSSFSRSSHAALAALGVRQLQGNLASFDSVVDALEGVDAVFHVAALAGAWGPLRDYLDANVRGTRHLLAACRMHAVRTLVHTSTPSVAHRGRIAVEGGDERSAPVATRFKAAYPATKAVAERAVLEANGPELATVALRPRLIWGPGDPHLLPRLVERARAGRLRLIGDGSNRIDTTYIDNAVDAHLAAFDALHDRPDAACAGRAYFISNGEPRPAARIINALLVAAGAPTIDAQLSFRKAYLVAAIAERLWRWLPLAGEPPLTRFIVEQLATPHWYDLGAARRDLGYQPAVSIDEGLARLAAACRVQAP